MSMLQWLVKISSYGLMAVDNIYSPGNYRRYSSITVRYLETMDNFISYSRQLPPIFSETHPSQSGNKPNL
ncbi:hypothetical protein NXS19_012278 [Fusarium pseudograminearum]|nr:hypothetical protein NXS19_012278 [Fusarium pseudograminearum]